MFTRHVVLRTVPAYATIPDHAVQLVEYAIDQAGDDVQTLLDKSRDQLRDTQPPLARWLEQTLSVLDDEWLSSFADFLSICTYLAFREAFGRRLASVDGDMLQDVLTRMELDNQLRASDPFEGTRSEQWVHAQQPCWMDFVEDQLEQALENDETRMAAIQDIRRILASEVMMLSGAVLAPHGKKQIPKWVS